MDLEEKPPDYFKCVKTTLSSVLKHQQVNLPKINKAVMMCNKIVIYCLMFMKLYILDCYEKHNSIPVIDKAFVNSCLKTMCFTEKIKSSGRPPSKKIQELRNKLQTFYDTEYKPYIQQEQLHYTHMNTVLDYLTVDILTMYENNVKLHFVEYVERYVNVIWKKKFIMNKINEMNITCREKEQRKNNLCKVLRRIKKDLLNIDCKYTSHSSYHKWITETKKYILPNRKIKKQSIRYDLVCSPLEYLHSCIFMMKQIENENQKVYNIFPMRNEAMPKHIRLDTTTLVHLLMTKKHGIKSEYLTKGNLKLKENVIWNFFFRTETQPFRKKHYLFHHMIETDGVSCSILLLRKDLVGKRTSTIKPKINDEKYIDELKNEDYERLQKKKIVSIDPGKCDLIYCLDNDNKEANMFRYSQDQRRKETKKKKYSKLQLKLKQEKVNGESIIEWETKLCIHNRKTLNITKFKQYIQEKSKINTVLLKFYETYIFRKLKLQSYRNTKRSEQRMINRFKKIFGEKEDVVVCFGDYEQRKHMKYKEPIKGKGMRTLFKKNGFETYLVDEYKTSKMCSKCKIGCCVKNMVMDNPRPFREGRVLVHGLICCKNGCGYWNRDTNGATNIYRIAHNSIHKKGRPSYLSRVKPSVYLEEYTQPKFTRLEMGKPC